MAGIDSLRPLARLIRNEVAPLRGYLAYGSYRRLIGEPRCRPGSVVFRGRRLQYSDGQGFLHSMEEIYRDQVYYFEGTDSPHIIDAGANVGLSVLYFKDLFPRSTVVAYEPDREIFLLLQKNVGHLSGVTLHNAAAWVDETELTFFRDGSLAGSVAADFEGKKDVVKVPAIRLRDEIMKKRVDFLKIDIEGAENAVLFDIADTLDNVDRLFFEYHSPKGDKQLLGDLLSLVTKHGFRYDISETQGIHLPFVGKANFAFDLQCNVACYRPSLA